MIPDIDGLVRIGQETLELAIEIDVDFLPKLLVARPVGDLRVVQYNSHDELVYLCSLMHGPINWLALTADGYCLATTVDQSAGIVDFERGELVKPLAEFFLAGDPRVSEVLTITVVSLGWDRTISLPYVRKGTTVEWGEPESHEGDIGRARVLLSNTLARLAS